jgi:hypothetical protein
MTIKLGIELHMPERHVAPADMGFHASDYTTFGFSLHPSITYLCAFFEFVRKDMLTGGNRRCLSCNVYYGLGVDVASRSRIHRFKHLEIWKERS